MKCLRKLLLVLSLIISLSVSAQRERNYIYLLDCTKSMRGYKGSPDIWDKTKDYLKKDLGIHSPGTSLHVIPFQGKAYPSFNFNADDYDLNQWKKIEEYIDEKSNIVTGTNICDAWDAINGFIDIHKDNYILLLTDGHDTENGMEAVARKLKNWCGKYPNTYAFYVLLTKAAVDKKVVDVINICDNLFQVDATEGIPVFGGVDNDVIYANTLNLKKIHNLSFSAAGVYNAKAFCDDPYFKVKIHGDKIKNGIVPIQIEAQKPISSINSTLDSIYSFTFNVKSDEVRIINPTVRVEITNKAERALELISEEIDLGESTWYDSFFFWKACTPDTLNVDLKAIFNDEAEKDGSLVELQVIDQDGGNDFKLFYNGQQLENSSFIVNSCEKEKCILSLVYNPYAKEGKRYFSIRTKTKHQLDKINDEPVEQYNLTLRSKYFIVWNPLKTILLWIGIIILAALLLWFLLIKHFIYPAISVRTIQISDPYFSKVNVKNKRRVVFVNKKMEQSLLSRIFTGEILYKTNEVWTSPLAFEAGAKKKTLRIMRTKDYVFDPYVSLLKSPGEYVIENINTKIKIKMSTN